MPDTIYTPLSQLYWTLQTSTGDPPLENVWQKKWTDSRSGVKNPHYQQQIKLRQNATTVLIGDRFKYHWRPGHALWRNPTFFGPDFRREFFGTVLSNTDYIDPDNFPADLFAEVNAVALTRFINNAVDRQRSFQGSTFFGELRETLRMIKNPALALRRGITEFSRASKKLIRKNKLKGRANATSRGLSGLWLESMFGWTPFISDIQSGMDAIFRLDLNPTIDIRAGHKLNELVVETFQTNRFSDTVRFLKTTNHSCSVRYKGEIWVSPPYLGKASFLSNWGFDPVRDFIPTVYELIPFSFLVDYFSNLGSVIQALTFWEGNFSWYCRTYEKLSIARSNGLEMFRLPIQWELLESQPEQHTVTRRQVVRDLPPTLVPKLTYKLPGMSLKWLNIAALANEKR